jgi:hypothetical protein
VLKIDRHLDGLPTTARDHVPTFIAIRHECIFADDVVLHGVPFLLTLVGDTNTQRFWPFAVGVHIFSVMLQTSRRSW